MLDILKKIGRYTLGSLLLLGSILSVGLLAFYGTLTADFSLAYAIAAFFFATVIEGEVLKQNIWQAMTKIFTTNFHKRQIILRKLYALLADQEKVNQYKFLQAYLYSYDRIKKLKESAAAEPTEQELLDNPNITKQDKERKRREELKAEKKALAKMENYFIDFMYGKSAKYEKYDAELAELFPKKEIDSIQKEVRKKTTLISASWILNVTAGLSCFFTTFHLLQMFFSLVSPYLAFLSLTGIGLTIGIYGIAILAAGAYTYSVYKCISDIINKGTIQHWAKKLYHELKIPKEGMTFSHGLKIAVSVLVASAVVALCVFATISGIGTWLQYTQKGAEYIPYIAKAAEYIRDVTIGAMGASDLIYNIDTSLKTVNDLLKIKFTGQWTAFKQLCKDYASDRNWTQIINIPRFLGIIIKVTFRNVFFLGHTTSEGLSDDTTIGNLSARTVGIINIGNSMLSDGHFIYGHDHDGKKKKQVVNEGIPLARKIKTEDGHHHSDIPGWAVRVLFCYIFFTAAVWDWGFSGRWGARERGWSECWREQFFMKTKKTKAYESVDNPNPTNPMHKQVLLEKFEKKLNKVNKSLTEEDKTHFNDAISAIQQNTVTTGVVHKNQDLFANRDTFKYKYANDKLNRFFQKINTNDVYHLVVNPEPAPQPSP